MSLFTTNTRHMQHALWLKSQSKKKFRGNLLFPMLTKLKRGGNKLKIMWSMSSKANAEAEELLG